MTEWLSCTQHYNSSVSNLTVQRYSTNDCEITPLLHGVNLIVKLDFIYFTAGYWWLWIELKMLFTDQYVAILPSKQDWRGEDRYQNGAVNYLAECFYSKAAWNISLLWSHTKMNFIRHYSDDNNNNGYQKMLYFLHYSLMQHGIISPSVAVSCIIRFASTVLWKPRNTDRDSHSKPTQINEILRQFTLVTS